MAEQTALVEHYQEIIDAEQFLMLDDENHDDPLFDLYVDDLQEPNGTDFSGTHLDENINNQNGNFNIFPENPGFGNPIQIPIWPVQPSPHSCTCCQTLREFFHINGTNVSKLDIHGRIGIISHAVLERYNDASSENHEYHMFDFCHESLSSVKQFLIKYCSDRKREGYIMLQDPLSYFYDTLCIGLDSDTDISPQQTSIGEDGQMNQEDGLNQIQQEGNRNGVGQTKRHVASQNRGKEQER
ncbi:hypothetical protein ACJIZ3_001676 [Penstemon smallii]|uniref:Uncharacterized protein n=1 Tax=Penstemon smallii TaxID=265156 RepID=A0ABD3U6Z6_9LAMI